MGNINFDNAHVMEKNMKPDALRFADTLERMSISTKWDKEAAAELRRLHEVNQSLEKRLFEMQNAAINLTNVNQELVEALQDMLSGWIYIRSSYGELYGVGWNRSQNKAEAALANAGERE